ncbi:MAG TPA: caspase family protein [Cyclobacteriaceae bacterium]|jgi:hypothetical protein
MVKRLLIFSASVAVSLNAWSQEIKGKSEPLYVNFQPATVIAAIPVITWITPIDQITTLKIKKGSVKVGVNSDIKLKNVTLYINNLPTANDRGLSVSQPQDAGYDEIFEKEVSLNDGDNEIKIVAEDITGKVTVESRILRVELPALMARNDYALLFATDEYDTWGDLINPVNDATTIGKELEEAYGFKVEVIRNPTMTGVLTKLREYAKKSYQETDQLFIFIAGHGQFDPFFNQGYLVCKDSRKDDEVKATYLSHSNLREIVNNIPSKHVFLAIDACFGGTFDPVIAKAGHRGGDDMYSELSSKEYIERKLRFKTRRYLTSGGKEYVPDGRPGRHSPFASKMLEALRNYGGSDKIITLPELMGFIEKINPEPRTGSFGDDEPGSDFVFVAK